MIDLILLKDSKLKIFRNLFVRLGAFIKLIEMVGPNDLNSTVMYQIEVLNTQRGRSAVVSESGPDSILVTQVN